jgi:putative polyhydroxyalkanoate system protein
MSTITVTQPHTLGADEARKRFDRFEDALKKFGVSLKWNGRKASIDGTGVSGDAEVSDRDVRLTIKLGFLAKAAGVDPVRLESSLKKRLAESFASVPPPASAAP